MRVTYDQPGRGQPDGVSAYITEQRVLEIWLYSNNVFPPETRGMQLTPTVRLKPCVMQYGGCLSHEPAEFIGLSQLPRVAYHFVAITL